VGRREDGRALSQLFGLIGQSSPARDRDALVLAALLSMVLHLALDWLIVQWQAPADSSPSPETEIALVSPSPNETETAPAARSGASSGPAVTPEIAARSPSADAPSSALPPKAPGSVWAQSHMILSTLELADPRNRKAAESLKRLEPQTRSQQLCDLEVILQINRQYGQYAVDFVIAYATEATIRQGKAIIARGAAFHSNGQWYNLAFECQIANQRDVERLKFKLGQPIPEERWADLNLPKRPANPLGGD
jgi:hypothetical protein